MTAYLRDRNSRSADDLPFPLDLTDDSHWRIEPVLVIEFSPQETQEILAALESARKDRYDNASATLTVSLQHSMVYRIYNKEAFYSNHLDAMAHTVQSWQPYDDGVKETLPDEWVSFERRTYGQSPYGYWQATHLAKGKCRDCNDTTAGKDLSGYICAKCCMVEMRAEYPFGR